jgi:hypothetical protein
MWGRCAPQDLFKSDNRRQKQEAVMSNDNKSALHRDQGVRFALEYNIKQATGYAVTEDGMMCVLRLETEQGNEVKLVIPTVQLEAVIGALRAAKIAAAAKTSIPDEGKANVFMPQRYETIRTAGFDGVLLAFDRGMQGEIIVGLDNDAAFNMGQDLRKQVRAANKLIVPDGMG